jgi:rhodanese-related sulfurtransferase
MKSMACALMLATSIPMIVVAANAPATSAAPAAEPELKAPVLDRAQVDALLAKPGKVLVIDLRRPDEQASAGTFPVYLSVQPDDLEKYLAWIPRDRQILTVSNHKGRSGKAANLLVGKGFKVAGIVGVEYYTTQGGKLNKIAAPAAAKP